MINIVEYTHRITIRLSDSQMDKINRSGLSASEFIRRSIDYYDLDMDTIIESERKNLIEEIQKEFGRQEDKFQKEYVQRLSDNRQVFLEYLVRQSDKCQTNISKNKERSQTNNNENQYNNKIKNNEALFLQILPTLQGMYHSEQTLTDEKIRFQANKIGVSTRELKEWMGDNHDLLCGYEFRDEENIVRHPKL